MNRRSISTTLDIYRRLCRARSYIDNHYNLTLDLAQISRQAFFSPYHFLRLFKQNFNRTPHEYLIQKRIEKAKELLSVGECTVTEVCWEVGFQSLGSFSSLFHKWVGYPPTVYRTGSLRYREVPSGLSQEVSIIGKPESVNSLHEIGSSVKLKKPPK